MILNLALYLLHNKEPRHVVLYLLDYIKQEEECLKIMHLLLLEALKDEETDGNTDWHSTLVNKTMDLISNSACKQIADSLLNDIGTRVNESGLISYVIWD
jgi:hypothetical protein